MITESYTTNSKLRLKKAHPTNEMLTNFLGNLRIWKEKTESHTLLSARDVSAKDGCEWDSNPCPHQPQTYSGSRPRQSLHAERLDRSAIAVYCHIFSLLSAIIASKKVNSLFW